MERIKALSRFQKAILLGLAVMAAAFTALYAVTIHRVGFVYRDAIFTPVREAGQTAYTARWRGETARFTVYDDRTVLYELGERTYGPYTAREDPTAIPQACEDREAMTGIELFRGETLLFRGGVLDFADSFWLYDEDGAAMNLIFTTGGGMELSMNDRMYAGEGEEPSVYAILELMSGPTLTHKGAWLPWLLGTLLSAATAFSMLFADELFRWELRWRIRDADRAEPSDWEMAGRYITWVVVPLMALFVYIAGLR